MLRSLGLTSDLLALTGVSEIEAHPDRVVVRTRAEPHYWFGNMVIFRGPEVAPEAQIAQFQADHPEALHVTLGWDAPSLGRPPELDLLAAEGFSVEVTDVLASRGPFTGATAPDGIDLRPISGDTDWAKLTDLTLEVDTGQGYDPEPHRAYVQGRHAAQRGQVERGLACWFGAFDGPRLVGSLGMVLGADLARYQAVQTRESHRRRGICAALVTHAAQWAAAERPGAQIVILVEQGAAAGRIYRRAGFALREEITAAVKGSYRAAS